MSRPTQPTTIAKLQQVIAGIQKHLPNATNIALLGATFTSVQLTTLFQAVIDALNAATAAKSAYADAVLAEHAKTQQTLPIYREFVGYIQNVYGQQVGVLGDFGATPIKPHKTPLVEVKAAANKKRQATRSARHTMGKDQKKLVTSEVTATSDVQPAVNDTPSK
jgi:hypothetical protein